MDRVPYRRVIPSRNSQSNYTRGKKSRNHENETITTGETIITQCIISGILLVVILLIGLIDFEPATTLRGGLVGVLAGATTVGELTADVRHFGEEWLGWENAVPENPEIPLIPLPSAYSYEHENIIPAILIPTIPLTADDEPLNPQIPGPSAVPGLWD